VRQTVKDLALAAFCGMIFVGATGGAVAQQVEAEKVMDKEAHKAAMAEKKAAKKADHEAKKMAHEAEKEAKETEETPNL